MSQPLNRALAALDTDATISELHHAIIEMEHKMSDPPPVLAVQNGNYTIRQKSSGQFLDAYENAEKDFRLVTRPAQDKTPKSGRWWVPTKAWSGPYARKAAAATSMPTRTKPTISV